MKYFYRSRDYVYIGFSPDIKLQEVLKKDFFAQFNPVNKEWYVRVDMTNISSINMFLEENGFTEERLEREQKLNLHPISEKLDMTDLKLILPELGLKRQLRDYQIDGVYYMLNHGNCINGSDVGVGKSGMTIVMFELIDTFPCLIVCPSTVKESWKAEWERWNPNRTLSIINSGSKKNNWDADVIVINYDALGMKSGRGVKVKFPELLSIKFKAIVADEIHFLKNWKAVRSKAFMKIASKSPIKIGLSGTVILNRPSELINILKVIGRFQEIFQDLDHYLYRYCNMKITRFGKETKDASNVKELYKLLNHYCYFRKEKREVLTELPPIVETFVNCKINNKKIYKEAENNLISFLELADETKVDAALKAKHLVQLNLLSLLSIDGKLKAIQEYLKDWIESNEEQKLLVFGVHVEPLEHLSKCFPESGLITGSISLDKKMKVLEQFKASKKMQILFANIQCIGTGVDGLQNVCSNAAVIELPVRPGDLVQGLGRLERMGQKSSINVFYLMNEETIDGRIWKMLKEKKEVTDVVNKGYLDDLSLSLINSYKRNKSKDLLLCS